MNPGVDAARPTSGLRGAARRFLREPLVHFLLIGVALVTAVSAFNANQRPTVRLDEAELTQLVSFWQTQTQRPPTPEELQGLIRERLDEEILAREAVRLGLDRDDIIIRRRLAQKMAFSSQDISDVPEPTDATLRRHYEATRALYARPALVTLRHVYFSGDRPAGDARAAAEAALQRLRTGAPDVAGDLFVLPLTYTDVSVAELDRDYGPAFAKAAEAAPLGAWTGPSASEYGWHLLRVDARKPAGVAPVEQVRAEVLDAYLADQRKAANAAFMDDLRKQYRVTITPAAAQPVAVSADTSPNH